jgi:hypothetical protein
VSSINQLIDELPAVKSSAENRLPVGVFAALTLAAVSGLVFLRSATCACKGSNWRGRRHRQRYSHKVKTPSVRRPAGYVQMDIEPHLRLANHNDYS